MSAEPKKDRASIMAGIGRLTGVKPKPELPPITRKARVGKRAVLTWHDPLVPFQIKELALEHDRTQQSLVAEALNMLFAKYGKPQIS